MISRACGNLYEPNVGTQKNCPTETFLLSAKTMFRPMNKKIKHN